MGSPITAAKVMAPSARWPRGVAVMGLLQPSSLSIPPPATSAVRPCGGYDEQLLEEPDFHHRREQLCLDRAVCGELRLHSCLRISGHSRDHHPYRRTGLRHSRLGARESLPESPLKKRAF